MRSIMMIAAAAILLAAPAHAQSFRIPSPAWAVNKSPEEPAYVLPASPVANWYEVRGGDWQLSLETVQEIRALIDARIGSNRHFSRPAGIAKYAIQFRGESRNGRPAVRLAGACRIYEVFLSQLTETFIDVHDGGECYFDAEYDPVEKRLRQFKYHGYG